MSIDNADLFEDEDAETLEIMVLATNRDASTVTVPVGVTISELATKLGLPDPSNIKALDDMSVEYGPDAIIGEDFTPEALSFIFRLAGA
jgi:hypothetical protein